jgi:hypothetical protein
MRVPVFCAAVVAIALGAVPASAQTADELVTKYYAARGGLDKLKAIQTLKITQTVANPFSSTKMTVLRKRPNSIRWEILPAGQTVIVPRALSAAGGWDTLQGKVVPRNELLVKQELEIDADIDGLLVDWKDKGHTVALEGTETIRGRKAHKLKITTKGGVERWISLDAETFLPAKEAGKITLPGPPDPRTKQPRVSDRTFLFSDWKDVNGVKFPFAVDELRIEGPIQQEFATYVDKIEVNVPVDDALFVMPKPAGGN